MVGTVQAGNELERELELHLWSLIVFAKGRWVVRADGPGAFALDVDANTIPAVEIARFSLEVGDPVRLCDDELVAAGMIEEAAGAVVDAVDPVLVAECVFGAMGQSSYTS